MRLIESAITANRTARRSSSMVFVGGIVLRGT